LRSYGSRIGIYARALAEALQRKDVQETTRILTRLGVSMGEQSSVPPSSGGRLSIVGVE